MYYSLLPSNFIEKIIKTKGKFIFESRGFGNTVGMCQFSANYLKYHKKFYISFYISNA